VFEGANQVRGFTKVNCPRTLKGDKRKGASSFK